jgi:hypothetical protein
MFCYNSTKFGAAVREPLTLVPNHNLFFTSHYSVFHRLLITGQSNSDDLHSLSRNVDSKKQSALVSAMHQHTQRSKPSKGLFTLFGAVLLLIRLL